MPASVSSCPSRSSSSGSKVTTLRSIKTDRFFFASRRRSSSSVSAYTFTPNSVRRDSHAPIWSICPWVSRIAVIFHPCFSAVAQIRSGSAPGSITTASFVSSFARNQQFSARFPTLICVTLLFIIFSLSWQTSQYPEHSQSV